MAPMADAEDVRRLALALPHVVEIDSGGFDLRGADKGGRLVLSGAQTGQAAADSLGHRGRVPRGRSGEAALLLGEPELFFTTPPYDGCPW